MALQFLIDTGEYDNILLIVLIIIIGEQTYYYPIDNINKIKIFSGTILLKEEILISFRVMILKKQKFIYHY